MVSLSIVTGWPSSIITPTVCSKAETVCVCLRSQSPEIYEWRKCCNYIISRLSIIIVHVTAFLLYYILLCEHIFWKYINIFMANLMLISSFLLGWICLAFCLLMLCPVVNEMLQRRQFALLTLTLRVVAQT